jgi:hypothetical protein
MKKVLVLILITLLTLSSFNNVNAEELSRQQKIINIIKNYEDSEWDSLLLELKPFKANNNEKNTITKNKILSVHKFSNKTLTFLSDGSYIIDILKKVENKEKVFLNSTTSYTSTYTKLREQRGAANTVVWKVWVKGYFGYDGTNVPTPYLVSSGYEKGFLSVWQVSDWSDGTAIYLNTKRAACYAKGYFHWGIEIDGNGVIFQDEQVDLRLYCDKDGNIS